MYANGPFFVMSDFVAQDEQQQAQEEQQRQQRYDAAHREQLRQSRTESARKKRARVQDEELRLYLETVERERRENPEAQPHAGMAEPTKSPGMWYTVVCLRKRSSCGL